MDRKLSDSQLALADKKQSFSQKALGILKSQSSINALENAMASGRNSKFDVKEPLVPVPFTIRGRDDFTGFNMAGITDSELIAFRNTNNVTNADLIMELKYSHLESIGNSGTKE